QRLIEIEPGAGVPDTARRKVAFTYDYRGRRLAKTAWTWDQETLGYRLSTCLRFLYDGWRLLAEVNASNVLVRSYLWGPDLSSRRDGAGGIGGLVALVDHEQARACFYAYDGSGHVRALIDATDGSVVARYDYGPFGELLRASGPMARRNPFRFS